jgi:ABC-type xylose transport system substrate-binding protein
MQSKEEKKITAQKWQEANKAKHNVIKRLTSMRQRGFDTLTILRPDPDHCEVCKKPSDGEVLRCDHDHETGKFRGWVCSRCNIVLGVIDQLENDAKYGQLVVNYKAVETANNAGVQSTREEVLSLLINSEYRRNPDTGYKRSYDVERLRKLRAKQIADGVKTGNKKGYQAPRDANGNFIKKVAHDIN